HHAPPKRSVHLAVTRKGCSHLRPASSHHREPSHSSFRNAHPSQERGPIHIFAFGPPVGPFPHSLRRRHQGAREATTEGSARASEREGTGAKMKLKTKGKKRPLRRLIDRGRPKPAADFGHASKGSPYGYSAGLLRWHEALELLVEVFHDN